MIDKFMHGFLNRVYDLQDYTQLEINSKLIQKMDEVIENCNNAFEFVDWLKEQGVPDEVQTKIDTMLEDGTLEKLINLEKLNQLSNDINSQLDSIENKANLANSKFRLTTVSAYDDIDSYHPKILRFNPSWNGYYYWMAFTPYPNGDQAKENPHILASNNMLTWVEPNGYKNPLEPQPEGTPDKQNNYDTH